MINKNKIIKILEEMDYFKYVDPSQLETVKKVVKTELSNKLSVTGAFIIDPKTHDYFYNVKELSKKGYASYTKRVFGVDSENIFDGDISYYLHNIVKILRSENINIPDFNYSEKFTENEEVMTSIVNGKEYIIYDTEDSNWDLGYKETGFVWDRGLVALKNILNNLLEKSNTEELFFIAGDDELVLLTNRLNRYIRSLKLKQFFFLKFLNSKEKKDLLEGIYGRPEEKRKHNKVYPI